MPKVASSDGAARNRALQMTRYEAYNAWQAQRPTPEEVRAVRKGATSGRRCVVYLARGRKLDFELIIKRYNDDSWTAQIDRLTIVEGYECDEIDPPSSTSEIELETPRRVVDVATDIVHKIQESHAVLSPGEKARDIANAILGPDGGWIVPRRTALYN